jgi:hypothetical protein
MTIHAPKRCGRAAIVILTIAVSLLAVSEAVHAQSYPLCGGRSAGTVCQTPICGSVPAGTACLLPLCGSLPPGNIFNRPPCEEGETLPACSSASVDTPCQPDNEIACGLVPPGYLCLVVEGGGPTEPICSAEMPIDTFCLDPQGNDCRVVSPGQYSCWVSGIFGEIECTGAGQIVQECIAGTGAGASPLFRKLTDDAIAGVLRDHQLPAEDAPLVMGNARDSVRAYLFAELLNVIQKNPRSPEEDEIVAFYAGKVRDLRVRQAQISEDEYARFAANPCAYVPPPGFTYAIPSNCAVGTLATLFANLSHPTLKEFKEYGIATVTGQEITGDLEALGIASATRDAILFGVGVTVIAGVLAGTVFIVLTATALGTTIAAALTPYALVAWTVVATAAAGAGVAIAAVAASVFAIVLLIVGIIVVSVQFSEYDKFVADVTSLVEQAQAVPDLRAAVQTERGMMDLYHVYVKSTQPDWRSTEAPPAPSLDDPLFELVTDTGAHLGFTRSILPFFAQWGQGRVLSFSTNLHGGWFRPTVVALDESNIPRQTTSLSLAITFVNWDGQVATAWRRGTQFLIGRSGPDGLPVQPVETDELQFLDLTQGKLSARIVQLRRPPPPGRATSSP